MSGRHAPPAARALTLEQARRLSLDAQGLSGARPASVTRAHMRKVVRRQGLLQIDTVNVLVRAQYMPVFSRLGSYDVRALDRMAYRDRELFEYWGHEASLIDMRLFPLFRHRMRPHAHPRMVAWVERNRALVDAVLDEVRDRGPLGVSDLKDKGKRSGQWWGWSDQKLALEHLFQIGAVTTAGRRNFERLYDLTERVIPADVLAERVSDDDARKRLIVHGATALGVGTATDILDYWRQHRPTARPLISELVEEGELLPVQVEGWSDLAYMRPGVRIPKRVQARALLSPFDPIVWERSRALRLFGFDYRIEIYVPQPKRRYGYYVLPFLLGEDIVARVDLKADRGRSVLMVQAAWKEPAVKDPPRVARALGEELRLMAAWLGLATIEVARKGTLAKDLRAAI